MNRKSTKGTRDAKLASKLYNENAEKGILFEIYRSTQSIVGGNFDTTFYYIENVANNWGQLFYESFTKYFFMRFQVIWTNQEIVNCCGMFLVP